MYFLAIDTTKPQVGGRQLLAPFLAVAHQHAAPVARLERGVLLERPAHLGQELGIVAAENPATQRLVAHAESPVVHGAHGRAVMRLGVGRMGGQVRVVDDVEEVLSGRSLVVCLGQVRQVLEPLLGLLALDGLAALDEVEVGRRLQHAVLFGRREGAVHDAVGLLAVRQPVLRVLLAGLGLRSVARPLPQGQHRLLGFVDDLLAELDRLGEDDFLLGVEQRHLADLLEVHAHRIVDADHVGGDRVELLGRRLLSLLRVELGRRLLPRRLLRLVERDLDT